MGEQTVIFGAVGDIDFCRTCGEQMAANGADWPFQKMQPHLDRADLLFGNMESVLLPESYPDEQIDPDGLCGKYDGTAALKRAGFDFACLANNHVLDGGHISMFHTRQVIESRGVATGGVGATQEEARRMVTLRARELKLGFLCYCEDTNYSLGTTGPCHAYYTPEAVLADVARCRREVDVLVVSIHADLEFMDTPSPPRREAFRQIARAGATVVLGHHPHVPQGVERIGHSLIAYSLGNFYFAAHTSPYMKDNGPHTAHSFLLLVEVGRDGVKGFQRVPFAIGEAPEQRPAPLEGEQADEMLAYLQRLDRLAADDEVVAENWRQIALKHFDIYLERVKKLSREDVLEELLGRLVLTAENRNWVNEVFAEVRRYWARRAGVVDPLHRPHYYFSSRRKQQEQVQGGPPAGG